MSLETFKYPFFRNTVVKKLFLAFVRYVHTATHPIPPCYLRILVLVLPTRKSIPCIELPCYFYFLQYRYFLGRKN